MYDSDLHCLRNARASRYFSEICCNSQFLFGLWDPTRPRNHESNAPDLEDEYENQRIQVLHLVTLIEASELLVPMKYTMHRIMADEHRLIAISRGGFKWFMSIFDLAMRAALSNCFFLFF